MGPGNPAHGILRGGSAVLREDLDVLRVQAGAALYGEAIEPRRPESGSAVVGDEHQYGDEGATA